MAKTPKNIEALMKTDWRENQTNEQIDWYCSSRSVTVHGSHRKNITKNPVGVCPFHLSSFVQFVPPETVGPACAASSSKQQTHLLIRGLIWIKCKCHRNVKFAFTSSDSCRLMCVSILAHFSLTYTCWTTSVGQVTSKMSFIKYYYSTESFTCI